MSAQSFLAAERQARRCVTRRSAAAGALGGASASEHATCKKILATGRPTTHDPLPNKPAKALTYSDSSGRARPLAAPNRCFAPGP